MEGLVWATVWDIAGKRHGTKQGKRPLTDHAYEVLESLFQNESQEAVANAMGFLMPEVTPQKTS